MPHVTVSEIVRAEPVEVFRLFCDVERFPQFMPNVESIQVVERGEGWSVSEWHTSLDGAPLQWREKDRQDEERLMIQFRLLDGDLARFEGYWGFEACAEGTLVTCEVDYELGVPVIEEVVGPVIRGKVKHNLDEMLRAARELLEVVGAPAGNP